MDWITANGAIVAALISSATAYTIFVLGRRQAQAAEQSRETRVDPGLAHQRRKALALLNHKTRMEHRIETLAKAFPELTREKTRELLRSVGAEPFIRKDGSESWFLSTNQPAIINRRRKAEGRKPWPLDPN